VEKSGQGFANGFLRKLPKKSLKFSAAHEPGPATKDQQDQSNEVFNLEHLAQFIFILEYENFRKLRMEDLGFSA